MQKPVFPWPQLRVNCTQIRQAYKVFKQPRFFLMLQYLVTLWVGFEAQSGQDSATMWKFDWRALEARSTSFHSFYRQHGTNSCCHSSCTCYKKMEGSKIDHVKQQVMLEMQNLIDNVLYWCGYCLTFVIVGKVLVIRAVGAMLLHASPNKTCQDIGFYVSYRLHSYHRNSPFHILNEWSSLWKESSIARRKIIYFKENLL